MAGEKVVPRDVVETSDYFPGVNEDLSLVTWAHAVNSHTQLMDALADPTLMMLEADVLSGRLEGADEGSETGPIMAHPPDTESDLSLAMWVEAVVKANKEGKKKGAKLDFKDLSIVKESLKLLESYSKDINFPLWLNADILKGPVDATTTPLDPTQFLALCVQYFPLATLSVGWTTRYTLPDDESGEYTRAMVEEMAKTLETANIAQPITFPIRAAFIGRSLESLDWLVDTVLDSTINVWSAGTDDIDPQAILSLQDSVGVDGVYLDLPEDQQRAVEEARVRGEADWSGGTTRFMSTTAAITTATVALASALAALYLYE